MAPAASMRLTEKLNCVAPLTRGAVPTREDPLKVSHGGRLVPLQVNGAVPPETASDCEYCNPEVIGGSDVAVMEGTGLIERVNCLVVAEFRLSTALMVNE